MHIFASVCACTYRQHLLPTHTDSHSLLYVHIKLSRLLSLTFSLSLSLSHCLFLRFSLSRSASPGANARAMPGLCPILVGTLALMMIETTNVSPQTELQPHLEQQLLQREARRES